MAASITSLTGAGKCKTNPVALAMRPAAALTKSGGNRTDARSRSRTGDCRQASKMKSAKQRLKVMLNEAATPAAPHLRPTTNPARMIGDEITAQSNIR
jgi:hypothetical protein